MPLILKRYSQDVDVEDESKTQNYLVFENGQGKEIRIRVAQETIVDVVKILSIKEPESVKPFHVEPVVEENESFSPSIEEDDDDSSNPYDYSSIMPNNEEDIPSL